MKKIIGKLLIVIGVVIIGGAVHTNYTISKNNEIVVNQYKENINKESKMKILDNVIGVIEIPKINLEVAVKKGTDEETLRNSVGHFEKSSLPGEKGNFAVAGHRAYSTNKFFSNLDKVEIGDEIKVLTPEKQYIYKVNYIEVMEPEQVEVLNSSKEYDKEITLITCTPKYVGSHRLVVKGECIE